MKRPRPARATKRKPRAGAGAGDRPGKPTPGWKGIAQLRVGWRNPRTPAVPATLDITLDEYFAAASVMGLLASQVEEPDPQWCADWSFRMGRTLAREARRRRRVKNGG